MLFPTVAGARSRSSFPHGMAAAARGQRRNLAAGGQISAVRATGGQILAVGCSPSTTPSYGACGDGQPDPTVGGQIRQWVVGSWQYVRSVAPSDDRSHRSGTVVDPCTGERLRPMDELVGPVDGFW